MNDSRFEAWWELNGCRTDGDAKAHALAGWKAAMARQGIQPKPCRTQEAMRGLSHQEPTELHCHRCGRVSGDRRGTYCPDCIDVATSAMPWPHEHGIEEA